MKVKVNIDISKKVKVIKNKRNWLLDHSCCATIFRCQLLSPLPPLSHIQLGLFSFPQNFSNILRKFTQKFQNKKNLFQTQQVPLISNPYDFSVFSFPSFHRFCSSFMLTSCVLCNTSHFNWHHFRIPLPVKFFPFSFLAKHYLMSQLNWK